MIGLGERLRKGLSTRAPVVVVYAFAPSSTQPESLACVNVHVVVSGIDKLAFVSAHSLSSNGSSVLVHCVLSSDGAFMFLHTCTELATGLAHVRAGTFRPRYLVHHVPLVLWWTSVLHAYYGVHVRAFSVGGCFELFRRQLMYQKSRKGSLFSVRASIVISGIAVSRSMLAVFFSLYKREGVINVIFRISVCKHFPFYTFFLAFDIFSASHLECQYSPQFVTFHFLTVFFASISADFAELIWITHSGQGKRKYLKCSIKCPAIILQ